MTKTIPLPDHAVSVAEQYAHDHGTSLEEAVTILVIKEAELEESAVRYPGSFRPFPRRPGTPLITSEMIYSILDDEE